MREFFVRLKRRPSTKPQQRDWTAGMAPRDWADLPAHHLRGDYDAF